MLKILKLASVCSVFLLFSGPVSAQEDNDVISFAGGQGFNVPDEIKDVHGILIQVPIDSKGKEIVSKAKFRAYTGTEKIKDKTELENIWKSNETKDINFSGVDDSKEVTKTCGHWRWRRCNYGCGYGGGYYAAYRPVYYGGGCGYGYSRGRYYGGGYGYYSRGGYYGGGYGYSRGGYCGGGYAGWRGAPMYYTYNRSYSYSYGGGYAGVRYYYYNSMY